MSDFDGLINLIPIDGIAKKLGVDPAVAKAAVAVAVPAIVGGLAANAKDADGAKSLEKALDKHTTKSTSLDAIDEEDGKKIVNHVFGAQKSEVAAAVAAKAPAASGVDMGAIVAKVLPIIAPIVLAFLAQQMTKSTTSTKATESAPASGGIGDILGSLISSPQAQGAIGGLLGGLFGATK